MAQTSVLRRRHELERRRKELERKRKEMLRRLKEYEERTKIMRKAMEERQRRLEEMRKKTLAPAPEQQLAKEYQEKLMARYGAYQKYWEGKKKEEKKGWVQREKYKGYESLEKAGETTSKLETQEYYGRATPYGTYKYAKGLVGEESAKKMMLESGYVILSQDEFNELVNKFLRQMTDYQKEVYNQLKKYYGDKVAKRYIYMSALQPFIRKLVEEGKIATDKIKIIVEPSKKTTIKGEVPVSGAIEFFGIEVPTITVKQTLPTHPAIETYNVLQKAKEIHELAKMSPSLAEKLALHSVATALEIQPKLLESGVPTPVAGLVAPAIYAGGTYLAGTIAPLEEIYSMFGGYNVPETVGGVITYGLTGKPEELKKVWQLGGFYFAGNIVGELLVAKAMEKAINGVIRVAKRTGQITIDVAKKLINQLDEVAKRFPRLQGYVDELKTALKNYGPTKKFIDKAEEVMKKIREWRKPREMILKPTSFVPEEITIERTPRGVKFLVKGTAKGKIVKGERISPEIIGGAKTWARILGKEVRPEEIWRLYGADMPYTVAGKLVRIKTVPELPMDMPPEIYKSLLIKGLPLFEKIKYYPLKGKTYEFVTTFWRGFGKGEKISPIWVGRVEDILGSKAIGEAKLVGKLKNVVDNVVGIIKGVMKAGVPAYYVSDIIKNIKIKIYPWGKRFVGEQFVSIFQTIPGYLSLEQIMNLIGYLPQTYPMVISSASTVQELSSSLLYPILLSVRTFYELFGVEPTSVTHVIPQEDYLITLTYTPASTPIIQPLPSKYKKVTRGKRKREPSIWWRERPEDITRRKEGEKEKDTDQSTPLPPSVSPIETITTEISPETEKTKLQISPVALPHVLPEKLSEEKKKKLFEKSLIGYQYETLEL